MFVWLIVYTVTCWPVSLIVNQVTEEDCEAIVKACKDNKVMLAVCHVLRYTRQAQKIKQLIDSGAIGDIVNIQLLEPVRSNSIYISLLRSIQCLYFKYYTNMFLLIYLYCVWIFKLNFKKCLLNVIWKLNLKKYVYSKCVIIIL